MRVAVVCSAASSTAASLRAAAVIYHLPQPFTQSEHLCSAGVAQILTPGGSGADYHAYIRLWLLHLSVYH